jgi:hypothetical protein
MDRPRPGDAHQKLAGLIGEWSGAETLHPAPWDPTGGKASARIVNRWIADGFAVTQDYEQRRGGKVTFSGHGVIWYDAAQDQYVMHWLDSMSGNNSEHRGGFSGGVLTLGAPMPQGGHGRVVFDLGTAGQYGFSLDLSQDGQTWAPTMTGTYRKGGAKKAAAKPAKKIAAKTKAPKSKTAPKKKKKG